MIKKVKSQIGGFLPFILLGLVVAFVFAIITIPVAYMGDEIMDTLKEDNNFGSSNESVARITQVQGLMTTSFDQLVFFILVGTLLGLIILAIFTDFHPVVLVFLLIVLVLLVILGGLFANAFDEVRDTEILSEKASEFTFTNVVMGEYLPIFILIAGAIAFMIILAKRGGQTSPV